jgi:hypothetical protein
MADQSDVAKLELLEHSGEVCCQGVEVIAVGRLVGARVPAPVIGDDAQSLGNQPVGLQGPDRRSQRPAVDEDDRLAGAAIDIGEPLIVACFHDARGVTGGRCRHGTGGERGEQGASLHEVLLGLSRKRCIRLFGRSMTWQVMTLDDGCFCI